MRPKTSLRPHGPRSSELNTELVNLLRYVSVAVYGGVAFAAWRLHGRLHTDRSRWLLVTFGILFAVIAAGLVLPDRDTGAIGVAQDVQVVVLLFFPYCLYRFGRGFRPAPRSIDVIALAVPVVLGIVTFTMAPLPDRGEPLGTTSLIYLVTALAYWTLLSLWVAASLWRGGRGQPGVARRRMRLLAVGTLAMNGALLIAGARVEPGSAAQLVTQLLVIAAAVMFLFGFAPPSALRHSWRQGEDRELRRAEAGLMAATTAEEVASTIIPRVADLLGGHGAALIANDGTPLAVQGFTTAEVKALAEHREEQIGHGHVVIPLRSALLAVRASPYSPFFGEDEVELLRSHGTFVDLALGRIDLYSQEQQTRRELERTNEELVALVYGISHDLRSPIVTVIGYLELLQSDAGDTFNDEVQHYLDRISVSARYMDALIRDLLELSRIGRTQTESEELDLAEIVSDVANECQRTHPEASVEIGDLPSVQMNAIRARQLFTNLIENAMRHGGRADITISVTGERTDDGAVITLADNGVGIAPAYRDRVFGIFERLDSDGGTETTGTGIGLAMCRKILDQVDGRIWIADAPVGTTFKISLPAAAVQRRASSTEVSAQ